MVENVGGQAVYRALDVVAYLGTLRDGARLSDVAAAVGLPASTVHRLLSILCDRRFAVQDPRTRRYALGPQARPSDPMWTDAGQLRDLAAPVLTDLRDTTMETVFLSVRAGAEIIYVDCVPAVHPVQMYGSPGMRVPVHATAQGKAILAHLPEDRLAEVLEQLTFPAFTEHTITSAERFRAGLAQVRDRGYALGLEEHEAGVISVAAAVVDPDDLAVGAVCVGCPRLRWDAERLVDEVAEPVRLAALRLGALLFPMAGARRSDVR